MATGIKPDYLHGVTNDRLYGGNVLDRQAGIKL